MTDRTRDKHTPGPWEPRQRQDGVISEHGDSPWTVAARGRLIATIHSQGGEELANANLIAAAPDLLALAREAREFLGNLDATQYLDDAGDLIEAELTSLLAHIDATLAKVDG